MAEALHTWPPSRPRAPIQSEPLAWMVPLKAFMKRSHPGRLHSSAPISGRFIKASQPAVGADRSRAVWQAGHAMSLAEAIDYALS